MALICLQYGQCGNQIGSELFKTVYEDVGEPSFTPSAYITELIGKWFDEDEHGARKARSILIDTEEKVVSNLKFGHKEGWSFDRNLVVTSKVGGSGNNWALGYYENGLEIIDKVLDLVDTLAERFDSGPTGILSLQGLGGGTGSGVSCFISQALGDQYPKLTRTSASVIPFLEGDICTQSYNAVLSVSKLYDSEDAIILFSNDYLYKLCSQVLKIKSVKISDMNRIISEQLASCLSVGKLSSQISHLTQHPLYKLISIRSTPHIPPSHASFEPTASWHSMVGQLKMSLVKSELNYDFRPFSRNVDSTRQRSYQYYKCVSNLLTCRGPDCYDAQMLDQEHPLNDSAIYPHWFPHSPNILFGGNNKRFIRSNRFATLMTNAAFPQVLLDSLIEKAWTMFTHEAYLHHYSKYGLTNKEFLSSFAKFDAILKNYNNLN